ncbi:hypothetical protein [Pseudodesulfovibrio pelocollis]|uniref:hypothetical protein n=1 Tax=Pseudodesulfovibrio pelocollis TaxID=3051432 RepID=UPI00255B397E|nr:hypothetical protein [Pseudodesulfovibrio sp. SB368]
MLHALIGWAARLGLGTMIKYAGYAVIAVALAWLWRDYQALRGEVAVKTARLIEQAVAHRAEAATWARREEQLQADLSTAAEAAAERLARSETIAAQVAKLKTIPRRPEHAQCPDVGPAVAAALDWLRPAADHGADAH